MRADGTMAIYAHVEGDPNGQLLSEKQSTPLKNRALVPDDPGRHAGAISWSRDDGTLLTVKDNRFRGGYFHLGRSSNDGELNLRNLSIN